MELSYKTEIYVTDKNKYRVKLFANDIGIWLTDSDIYNESKTVATPLEFDTVTEAKKVSEEYLSRFRIEHKYQALLDRNDLKVKKVPSLKEIYSYAKR